MQKEVRMIQILQYVQKLREMTLKFLTVEKHI